jgi:hypothetical protein
MKPDLKNRICPVCLNVVPEGKGIFWSGLGVIHQGKCYERAKRVEKDYSRSKRGRIRRSAEMRRLLVDPLRALIEECAELVGSQNNSVS